jgi:hypothetical protein
VQSARQYSVLDQADCCVAGSKVDVLQQRGTGILSGGDFQIVSFVLPLIEY